MSWLNLKTDFVRLQLALMLVVVPALLFTACASPTIESANESKVRKFLLLRHAEKETGTPDPALSPKGHSRTGFFASWLGEPGQNYEAVWSSDYRRTRDTAGPIAESLGTSTRVYDPRELPALVKVLLESDVNAVVVGHSNTTPELAGLLCLCEVAPMNEDDYEHGFLVTFMGEQRALSQPDFQELWTDRPEVSPAPDPVTGE